MNNEQEGVDETDRPEETPRERWRGHRKMRGNGAAGGVYGLAFLGALVYYIQHATSFGMGLLGFLKALIWPAMVVYHLMGHLGM